MKFILASGTMESKLPAGHTNKHGENRNKRVFVTHTHPHPQILVMSDTIVPLPCDFETLVQRAPFRIAQCREHHLTMTVV